MSRFRLIFVGVISAWLIVGSLPTAAQDATPEVMALELTETYTTPDKRVSFNYPENWVLHTENLTTGILASIRIGNTYAASNKELYTANGNFQSGEISIRVGVSDLNEQLQKLPENFPGITIDMSVTELAQAAVNTFPLGSYIQFGEVVEVTIGDYPAAMTKISVGDEGEGVTISIDYGHSIFGGLTMGVTPGELDQWLPTALAIVESITYNGTVEVTAEAREAALPLTETYTAENSMFSVDYPAGWTLETYGLTTPRYWHLIANFPNNQSLTIFDRFPPGSVLLALNVVAIENFVPGIQRDSSEITPEDVVRFGWFGLSADQAAMVNDLIQTPASNGSFERGSIQTFMLGEQEAARIDLRFPGFHESFALAFIDNDIVVQIRLITALGELDQWTPTAIAIAKSITYSG